MTTVSGCPTQVERGLGIFNELAVSEVVQDLYASCHLPVLSWAETVGSARPYDDVAGLISLAQKAVQELTREEVVAAHTGLTRLGAPIEGNDAEARWSRTESGGMGDNVDILGELEDANGAYEERFGHVFLISATDLSGQQIVETMRQRTENDDATETQVIKDELSKLVAIRLPKLLHELANPGQSR